MVIEDEDLVGGEAGEGSSTSHAEPDDEDSDKKEKEDLDDEATRQQDEDTTRLLILLQMAFGDQPCEWSLANTALRNLSRESGWEWSRRVATGDPLNSLVCYPV